MADVAKKTVSIYIDQSSADLALKNLQAQADKLAAKIDAGRAAGKGMAAEITKLESTKSAIKAVQDQIDKGLRPTLLQQENLVSRLRNELRRMSEDAPGYAEKFKAFQAANATLQTMQQRLSAVSKENKSLLSQFKPAAIAVAIGNGISNLVSSAVSSIKEFISDIGTVTNKYEKLQALLSNTLGGKEAGADAFAMLTQFAAETPFQLDELTAAYLKLINRGIKPTKDELAAFGDIAAAQGKSFDQFTEAILDATSGQYERLKEFGITAEKAGNQVTLAFGNISKTVPKSSEAIKNAIIAIRNEAPGIAGAMKVIAGTTEGALSNMADGFDRLKNSIGERFSSSIKSSIGVVGDLTNSLNDLVAVPVEEKIRAEQAEFGGLLISLGNVNISSEARRNLITEITQKYPELIRNINLENASQAQLNELYASGNKYFAERIRLAGLQGAAGEASKDAIAATAEIARRQRVAGEALTKLGVDFKKAQSLIQDPTALNSFFDHFKRGFDLTSEQLEGLSDLEDVVKGKFQYFGFGNAGKNLTDLMKVAGTLTESATNAQKLLNNEQSKSVEKRSAERKSLEDQIALLQKRVDKEKLLNDESTSYLQLQKQLGELQFRLAPYKAGDKPAETPNSGTPTLTQAQIEAAEKKRIAAENKRLAAAEKLKRQEEKDEADHQKRLRERLNFENDYTGQIRKLYDERLSQYPDLQEKINQFLDTDYNAQLTKLKNFYEEKRRLFINDKPALAQINAAEAAELQAYNNNQITKGTGAAVSNVNDAIERARAKEKAELIARDELDILNAYGKEKLDARVKQLEDERTQQLANTTLTEADRLLIIAQSEKAISELKLQYEVERLQMVLDFAQQASGILSSLADIANNKEDAALARDKKANDQKRKNLEQQLKSKAISQQEYNRKIAALDDEDEARQEAVKKKQFERGKKMQLLQVAISTAQAIISTLAAPPGAVDILSLGAFRAIQIGFAVATGAAQAAAIASKKYARGGFLEGPSHAENGIAMINRQTGQEVGEAEGGEVMLSKKTVRNNWDVISPLLQSSLSGTGARVTFPWQSRSYQAINYSNATAAVRQVRKFENGGFIDAGAIGANAEAQAQSNAVNVTLLQMMDRLNRRLNEPLKAYTSMQDQINTRSKYDRIVNDATVTR